MTAPKKILFWTTKFWPEIGGIEVLSLHLIAALRERGFEFSVITSQSEAEHPAVSEHDGVTVHRFRFAEALHRRDLRQTLELQRRVRDLKQSFKPDLVHLHFPGYVAYFHLSTVEAHPSPLLLTLHSDFSGFGADRGTLFGQVLSSAAWVNAVSRATLASVVQAAPAISDRSSVIPNGLPMPELLPTALPFDPPRILYLGRLVPEKGVDLAISAFASVLERFPEARLTIAGDGPTRGDLERQAAAHKRPEQIDFIGWIAPEKVPELMNTATVVVVPSRYAEPFALVALQAAQMGRPVVATRMGGLPETVLDGETGVLVESDQAVSLAETIIRLLEDRSAAAEMGKAARGRAERRFSLAACASAYETLYTQLIAGNRARRSV